MTLRRVAVWLLARSCELVRTHKTLDERLVMVLFESRIYPLGRARALDCGGLTPLWLCLSLS
jgi:hypothetical protein